MSESVAVGIDLGGTNVKVALVDVRGRIKARWVSPLDPAESPSVTVREIVATIDSLLAEAGLSRLDLAGVGIGAPGPMDLRRGRIVKAANLPAWHDVPIRELMSDALIQPVVFDNDGNAAAYGEHWAGAGRGSDDMVMLTLGTGIGGGVILGGRVLHGHFENAAELGHTIVAVNGAPCTCGQRGCLEAYASARAVAQRASAALAQGESSTLRKVADDNLNVQAVTVAQHARGGDSLARRVWDDACLHLAVACVNVQHAYNPARIVLGGGLSRAGDLLLDGVREHFARQKWSLHDDLPTIELAALGYDAGLIGAAGLGWHRHRRPDE